MRSTSPSSSTRSSLLASREACLRFRRGKWYRAGLFEFAEMRGPAPVNEPFSCPNNSDSINSAGTAAQLRVTNGPLARDCAHAASCHQFLTSAGLAQDANARLAAATFST